MTHSDYVSLLYGACAVGCSTVLIGLLLQPNSFAKHVMIWFGWAGAAILLGNSWLLLIFAVLTLGLGFIVVLIVANVTFYYLLAMPALYFTDGQPRRAAALPIFTLPVLAALLVPLAAWAGWTLDQRAHTAQDRDQPLPAGIEIIQVQLRTDHDRSDRIHIEYEEFCGVLCQRLLAEGHAKSVRMVKTLPERGLSGVEYTLIDAIECAEPLHHSAKIDPSYFAARAEGKCLKAVAIGESRPDLAIQQQRTVSVADASLLAGWHIRATDTLEIHRVSATATEPIVIRSKLSAAVLAPPLSLSFEGTGSQGMTVKWGFTRMTRVVNDYDLPQFVVDRLARARGVTPIAARDPNQVRATERRALLRIMDGRSTEPFPKHLQGVLQRTVHDSSWPPAEKDAFLVRVAEDRRFVDVSVVVHAIASRPEALHRALPALLRRLEAPPIADKEVIAARKSHDFDRSSIGYAMRRASPEALAPYSDRIVAMVAGSTESWTAGLVETLALLDTDTTALIRSRLEPGKHDTVRDSAARAACRARSEVQLALKDDLLRALRSEAARPASDRLAPIARALVRMGEKAAVAEIVADPAKLKRIHPWDQLEAGFDPQRCH